jgi:hypothetical protein
MDKHTEMMQDAQGRLVPIEMIRPADIQRNALVQELFARYADVLQASQTFRDHADAQIDAHLQLVAEQYGVKMGGQVGNLILTSYDGTMRVQRAVDKVIAFTDEIHAAKKLIFACVEEWTSEARPEIKVLVEDAFRQDKQGHLSAGRILGLLRLEIADERWQKAMLAIRDSVRVQNTRTYLRFYRRTPDGSYAHIPSGI